MAKYAHIIDGKVVNFVEWDGEAPFKVDGTLEPYVAATHEPHTIPVPRVPGLWERFKALFARFA
jgi:hypothetical protein